jgi:polar amino acid transport system substrate-binding protein
MLTAAAPASGMTICVSDRPAAPLTFPDHEGQAQYLARAAARVAGIEAKFVVLPWKRCVESIRSGLVDGALGAQAFHAYKDEMRFPLKGNLPDTSQSIGVDTWVLVTRTDAKLQWDGKTIAGLTLPVSYPSGVKVVQQQLTDLKIANVDSAKTALQLLQMLSVGRYQAVVIRESDAQGMLAQKEFKSLRILAPVFMLSNAYLVFGNAYAQANPGIVAATWEAIRNIRASREWSELAPSLAK